MDRLTLVELIESETAKPSSEGRGRWEEYNAAVYLSPDEERIPYPDEIALFRRLKSLPQSDKAL
jgi:hypothetical protein